jgi:hypothetical protein
MYRFCTAWVPIRAIPAISEDVKARMFERSKSVPRLCGSPRSYLKNESVAFAELEKAIESKHLLEEQREC